MMREGFEEVRKRERAREREREKERERERAKAMFIKYWSYESALSFSFSP